jgi:signal peptidase I
MIVIRVVFVIALLAMSLAWLLLFRPTFLGGPATYVIVAGRSMEPTLDSGALVMVRQRGSYGNGDIVAFRVPEGKPGEGAIVIHRIVGGSADEGFVVRGDNKEGPDPWHPAKDDIVGKRWFSLPGGSRFLAILRAPLPLAALAGGLAMLLVLSGPQKRKRPRQPSPAEPPHSIRRPRPRGLRQGLLLILTAGARTALRFTARHQRGGRHP